VRNKTLALGLGSNLERPLANLRRALSEIKKSCLFKVLKVSSIYESDALLPKNAQASWNKKFLNAVVLVKTSVDCGPEEILFEIKKIEKQMGRVEAERWAPRLIDIDVLYWSEADYQSASITIPHTSLWERAFALSPLLEVWPELSTKLKIISEQLNTHKSQIFFWPKMVGVLNVTSDSFSDGGKFFDSESLVQQCKKLVSQGADIIDIGAESTRPGAAPVHAEQEYLHLTRALSEIEKLSLPVSVSLDCRKPEVVHRIIEKHKINYLNDVSGFESKQMQDILKSSGLTAFVMHSLSIPPIADKTLPLDQNPCAELSNWWHKKYQQLVSSGISADKIIFDVGIGFGKTKEQNMYILQNLEQLNEITEDIMIGHSRKSFLTLLTDKPAEQRDPETALITQQLNLAFTQYLRVHDVESQKAALI
jgi:2-amino-4-hydroxy-6-hydroxymethyldihydropteridine diphosphokinase / dihydropteroate synthase